MFYPNKDTAQKCPRRILVLGRPGIGKTVLTEKIMHDWAHGVDEFYLDKIGFYFKFRWFNVNDMKDITLKTFLRYGTELTNDKFGKMYEKITQHPEKAILIFDGLDEFNGNCDCINDLPPPNDHDFPMSAISLFIKLISGRLLPEATILVTSRPTANESYSKFKFCRTVEIIGFTLERIEEYVTKFCQKHQKDYCDHNLKPKIWKHIQSSSDLLNSCYIPVNCWIVVTILFEKFKDPRNVTDALPTTLTELYQAAVTHLDENHFTKVDGQSYRDATKELQSLAFRGIEPMQLIFDKELFDEQMKQSGFLNSLSNPHSQAQKQFCFIHLTIQEFLAARHVTQTFTSPEEIKKFIFSHINSSKWHLVLQFIAGLLGKEIKMFQKDCYMDCVLAFAKCFRLAFEDDKFDVTKSYTSLLIMKCLREMKDEEIVKEACEATAINDIVDLRYGYGPVNLTSSDWSVVFFVCKHMKNLKKLDLFGVELSQESYLEALKLLEQRCIQELLLRGPRSGTTGNIFESLLKSKCSLNHEQCNRLTKLHISDHNITGKILSTMCAFFRNGHAVYLQELHLSFCEISWLELSVLCEILDNKLCPELTFLGLGYNNIADKGLTELCQHLTNHRLLKLAKLNLWGCSLTNKCVPALCEPLRNKCCNLTDLSLADNPGIKDEGLRILCEQALTNEHCKLEKLDLGNCSLSEDCLPDLCYALQCEHCKLTCLSLDENKITDKGLHMLCELTKKP